MGYVVKAIKGVAEGSPKITGKTDYTGQDLVKDANRLFTSGGFKLADKQVEPRQDNPKKISTTYFWHKKVPGLGVQELMIEIYNYAPNRTYYAVNDYSKDGAKVTPGLAQLMWIEMQFQIDDMSSQAGLAEGGRLDMSSPEEKAARKAYIKANGHPPPLTPDSVVAKYNPENDKKMRDYYLRRKGIPQDKLDKMKEDGVAEAKPDVMRHAGDKTVRVVKRRGKPVGEIGIDAEASPGNGQYYVKLYDGSYDASGFDTAEEALEELKYAMSEGVAEATGDPKFDKMLKGITGKKAVAKQQKTDTKQQSRDAFGSMFGGNSSDLMKNLKIRESGKLKEDATGGGTGSSSVAVTMQTLGEKGAFSKKEINKKLGGYTNQLTSGGPVKIGKAK
jgi:hypothetical protein